jgi:hypothetical protein
VELLAVFQYGVGELDKTGRCVQSIQKSLVLRRILRISVESLKIKQISLHAYLGQSQAIRYIYCFMARFL